MILGVFYDLSCYCQFLTFSAMENNLSVSVNEGKLLDIEAKKTNFGVRQVEIKSWIFHCVTLAKSITFQESQFSHLKNGDNDVCIIGKSLWELNEGMRNHGELGSSIEVKQSLWRDLVRDKTRNISRSQVLNGLVRSHLSLTMDSFPNSRTLLPGLYFVNDTQVVLPSPWIISAPFHPNLNYLKILRKVIRTRLQESLRTPEGKEVVLTLPPAGGVAGDNLSSLSGGCQGAGRVILTGTEASTSIHWAHTGQGSEDTKISEVCVLLTNTV